MLGFASDAGAHSDQGLLSIEATADEDRRITITAKLTYANDRDPVRDAEVSAVATNAADEATAPTTLAPNGEGRYEGTLEVPSAGDWNIAARSEKPEAIANTTVIVAVDPPTTASPTTPSTTTAAEGSSDSADDDEGRIETVAVMVTVIALGTSLIIILQRRRTAR